MKPYSHLTLSCLESYAHGNVCGQLLSAVAFICEGMMAGILAACFKTRVSASEEAQFCQCDETQAEFSNMLTYTLTVVKFFQDFYRKPKQ